MRCLWYAIPGRTQRAHLYLRYETGAVLAACGARRKPDGDPQQALPFGAQYCAPCHNHWRNLKTKKEPE
jgi:hypothetical protein